VESDIIPQPSLEPIERVKGADLVVGILNPSGDDGFEAAATVREAVERFAPPLRAVLVVNDGAGGTRFDDEHSVPVLFCKLSNASAQEASAPGRFDAYPELFSMSARIGARACGVISSESNALSAEGINRLVRPALEMQFDLVAPRYARGKWEGLINRSILSPITRALYGKRVQNPIGPDFALSDKMMAWILADHVAARRANPSHPPPPIVSAAVRSGFQICEAEVGERKQPPADGVNVSSLLAQFLGPVFLDMDRNAATWQRMRGSQAVPVFERPEGIPTETGAVDVKGLIDSYQLGVRNLHDIWSLALPPTILLEVRKLAALPQRQFRMPDELWVKIVWDFALAHRIRTINRDHLLRSFTPLYLGWIASYALEMETAGPASVDARMERLARAYEADKPYLMSRWRWPDRFNP